jgi:membrane protease YdiL (CAAX protease family)
VRRGGGRIALPTWGDVTINAAISLFLAFCALLLAGGIWVFYLTAVRLLGPQRQRLVPWSGWEVLGVFVLVRVIWPALLASLLSQAGFFTWLYGPETIPSLKGGDAVASARVSLWLAALAFPVELLTHLLLLRLASGTRPYQLGLTTHRFGANTVLGLVSWYAFTPLLFGLNLLIVYIYSQGVQAQPEKHPIQQLAEGGPTPVEWTLVVFTATLAAPVLEEVLFRGVLQPWLVRRDWGGHLGMVLALGMALVSTRWNLSAWGLTADGLRAVLHQLSPALFVLAMVPGYFLVRWLATFWEPPAPTPAAADLADSPATNHVVPADRVLPRPPGFFYALREIGSVAHRNPAAQRAPAPVVAGAVYATALMFAVAHSFAWPTPIALFFLAVLLGWLAHRTQSLVAPIVVHSLFNGLSCALLLVQTFYPLPPTNGNDATSAVRRPAAVSTSTTVPGSW